MHKRKYRYISSSILVYAFLQYLLATFRKMVTRGFIKALCQLTILLLFVEAARTVLLLWRFMTHRKQYKQRHDASRFTYYIPETAVLDNEKECSVENY